MKIDLFPDQKTWCRDTVNTFENPGPEGEPSPRRVMSTAGTGAGKTIMSSAVGEYALKRWKPHRILFLADAEELIDQAQAKFFWATGIPTDREQGSHRASMKSKAIVASIQTLAQDKRLKRFAPDQFGLVIADEAHLSAADTWQTVLNYFDGGGSRSLGITATPFRGDDRDLWKWWEAKGASLDLFDLIDMGRLSPIRVKSCPIDLDVSEATDGSDVVDEEALTHAIEPAFEAIIDTWIAKGEGRKTLWFLPGCDASKNFAERLRARGLTAEHIDGKTKDRRKILEAYKAGKFDHLTNADLLMKGYDEPSIEAVVILKLTKSRVAYQQMVGRGTRIHEGKKDMLLLDFLFQFDSLGIQRPADLVARNPAESRRIQERLEADGDLDVREARELSEIESVRNLVEGLLKRRRKRGETYDAREAAAVLHAPELLEYEPAAPWETLQPSPRQLSTLAKYGVEPTSIKTRGEASNLITFLLSRSDKQAATLKQVVLLESNGVTNAAELTIDEASREIEKAFAK